MLEPNPEFPSLTNTKTHVSAEQSLGSSKGAVFVFESTEHGPRVQDVQDVLT